MILARLKESEELYKTLVGNLVYPIIIHQQGKVIFANQMVLDFAGCTVEEIAGKQLSDIFRDPEDEENIKRLLCLFTNPAVSEEEIEIRTESGKLMLKTFLLRNNKIRYLGKEAVMSILFDITNRRQLEKYILDKVIETEEKDRKQFAADLHDDLGPTLSAIKLHLGLAGQEKDRARLEETLSVCKTLLDDAIGKMRIISNNLMPRLIEDYGLEAALNSFIKTVQREDTFMISFMSNLGEVRFQKATELHLYRIITELINNTIKHAGADSATLKINYQDKVLKITYSDNGKGYVIAGDGRQRTGMGIGNILNRVDIISGKITFGNRNGKTEVKIVRAFPGQD